MVINLLFSTLGVLFIVLLLVEVWSGKRPDRRERRRSKMGTRQP